MPRILLTLLSFGSISVAHPQSYSISRQSSQANISASSFEGERVKGKADDAVEGNPYLFEDWKSGEVILKNDEKYNVEKINLDASGNHFVYYRNDTIYEFLDNVKEIKIYNENPLAMPVPGMVFRSDINPLSTNFVEILTSGKITIFQEYVKKPEGENYSNGIVNSVRKYTLHSTQYVLINKKPIPLKLNPSFLEELTQDKKTAVAAYIKENGLKPKKLKDFLLAIIYYNSISTPAN